LTLAYKLRSLGHLRNAAVARRFAEDIRAFFAETNRIKADEIAPPTLRAQTALQRQAAPDRREGDVPADERSRMTVDADDDRKLLRKLIAQGGSKYTAGNIDRRKYERLVELGWLAATSPNMGDVLYVVTDKGRQDAS
jgi:hypothetical protein